MTIAISDIGWSMKGSFLIADADDEQPSKWSLIAYACNVGTFRCTYFKFLYAISVDSFYYLLENSQMARDCDDIIDNALYFFLSTVKQKIISQKSRGDFWLQKIQTK